MFQQEVKFYNVYSTSQKYTLKQPSKKEKKRIKKKITNRPCFIILKKWQKIV